MKFQPMCISLQNSARGGVFVSETAFWWFPQEVNIKMSLQLSLCCLESVRITGANATSSSDCATNSCSYLFKCFKIWFDFLIFCSSGISCSNYNEKQKKTLDVWPRCLVRTFMSYSGLLYKLGWCLNFSYSKTKFRICPILKLFPLASAVHCVKSRLTC